jgi:hypothetical protein
VVFRHQATDTPDQTTGTILQGADNAFEVQVGEATELHLTVARVENGLLGGDRESTEPVDNAGALAKAADGRLQFRPELSFPKRFCWRHR